MAWHNFFLYSFAIPFPLSTVLGWKQNFYFFFIHSHKIFFIAVTWWLHECTLQKFHLFCVKNNMYILVIVNVAENCSHIFINDKKFIEINSHYSPTYIYTQRCNVETNLKQMKRNFHLFSILYFLYWPKK